MLILLDKQSGVPVFRQIVEQVKNLILSEQLSEGMQITSVKELSQQLQINPMTVSKSYSLLEIEGFLERRKGIGLFITKPKIELIKGARISQIEDLVNKLAITAIQLGLSENDLIRALSKAIKKLDKEEK